MKIILGVRWDIKVMVSVHIPFRLWQNRVFSMTLYRSQWKLMGLFLSISSGSVTSWHMFFQIIPWLFRIIRKCNVAHIIRNQGPWPIQVMFVTDQGQNLKRMCLCVGISMTSSACKLFALHHILKTWSPSHLSAPLMEFLWAGRTDISWSHWLFWRSQSRRTGWRNWQCASN